MHTGCYRCRGYNVADCDVPTGAYRCRGYNVADRTVPKGCYICKGYNVRIALCLQSVICLGV